jgi:hypothetical protein
MVVLNSYGLHTVYLATPVILEPTPEPVVFYPFEELDPPPSSPRIKSYITWQDITFHESI